MNGMWYPGMQEAGMWYPGTRDRGDVVPRDTLRSPLTSAFLRGCHRAVTVRRVRMYKFSSQLVALASPATLGSRSSCPPQKKRFARFVRGESCFCDGFSRLIRCTAWGNTRHFCCIGIYLFRVSLPVSVT